MEQFDFLLEFSKLNESTLLKILETVMESYKNNPDRCRSDLIAWMGICMMKLHGEPPEEIMEEFRQYKNFQDLTKFTGG